MYKVQTYSLPYLSIEANICDGTCSHQVLLIRKLIWTWKWKSYCMHVYIPDVPVEKAGDILAIPSMFLSPKYLGINLARSKYWERNIERQGCCVVWLYDPTSVSRLNKTSWLKSLTGFTLSEYMVHSKKILVEKMVVERKPAGKKAWHVLKNVGKKAWSFLFFIHIKSNDEEN